METLSEILKPYENVVAQTASTITMLQFFAPCLICMDIFNAKSTKGKPALPFVGGVIMGCFMMIYAKILNDPVMIQVNYVGISLNTLYVIFYYIYAKDKYELIKPLSYGTAILAIVYAYSKIEDSTLVEHRIGIFVTGAMFAFLASPLLAIKDIVKYKTAEELPMPMIFAGSVVSLLWLLYGIIILNNFMIIQNLVGLMLCITQILVWIFFRGGNTGKHQKKEKKRKDKTSS